MLLPRGATPLGERTLTLAGFEMLSCYIGLLTQVLLPPVPLQQKRKLRIYISNTFSPSKVDGDNAGTAGTPGGTPAADKVASWELRVEGKLLDDVSWERGVGGEKGVNLDCGQARAFSKS